MYEYKHMYAYLHMSLHLWLSMSTSVHPYVRAPVSVLVDLCIQVYTSHVSIESDRIE